MKVSGKFKSSQKDTKRSSFCLHQPFRRSALTLIEVIVVVGIALILVTIFILMYPMMEDRRWGSCRTVCAANMKGIGTGMYTYAYDNNDHWPIAHPFPEPTQDETGAVEYVGVMGKDDPTRGRADDENYGNPQRFLDDNGKLPVKLSNTRSLWVLIRTGASAPLCFICPSSDDYTNEEDNPQNYWDFGYGDENKEADGESPWTQCSYGYQIPWGKVGQPSSDRLQDMPLAADKGPFSGAHEAGLAYPGPPAADQTSSPDDWSPWNSPNHGGEGQVVLFADGHAEFLNKPIAGIKNDNIYTRWSSADGGSDENSLMRIQGTPPTKNETPWSNTDTLIYP